MHILMTGGTGLIGRKLSSLLIERHSLIVLTRDITRTNEEKITFIHQLESVDFNQIDAVINLAGEPIIGKRWSDKQKTRLIESRVGLTEQLSRAIKSCDNPPHTFISGSAIGFYGDQDAFEIDEEFTDIKPDFSHQLCKDWEDMAMRAQSDKTRVCLLRTGIVLAKEAGALAKMRLPFKFALGGPIGNGKQGMSWIHIDDMANIILFALNNTQIDGVINATAPSPVSNNEFTQSLANAVSRPAIFRTPSWVFKIMMGEMAELVIQGQFVVPKKLMQQGFQFQYPDLGSALKSFDL